MTEVAVPAASGVEVVNESPLANLRLELVDSIDQAFAFKRWLGERRRTLGVDTETGGLKPERDRLRMVQFGDLTTGWAIPWEHWSGVALEALRTYEEPMVMHNLPFDGRFLQTHAGWQVPWHRIDDTMVKAHLVDPSQSNALKALSDRLIDRRASAGQKLLRDTMTRNRWTWDTVPYNIKIFWMYAALDPVLTCHVDEKLDPLIKQRGYERAYDLEMAAARVCTQMMLKGVRVDLEYCERKSKELRDWCGTARRWIRDEFGVQNATSNSQVISRLLADGVQLTKRTPSGYLALDKEVLEAISFHPLARYVLAIRRAEKICSAYLENFSSMVGPDGRVHANIKTLAAHTGRMSITEPALQTLLRDDPTVRDAFVPSELHWLVTCDADQIEARLATHFSNDPGMISAFLADGDFFCEIASQIFDEPIIKGDKRRQITKNTVYGKIYGAGATTIARTAKVTPEVAEAFIQRFDRLFPGIHNLMEIVTIGAQHRRETEGRAYVKTPLGRDIPVSTRRAEERDYALVNYLIQGHAAEILKRGLVDLEAAGVADYLVLPVHDEVIMDVPAGEVEDVKRVVEATLNDTMTYAVPLTWSAEAYDDRWGSKYRKAA